MYYYRVKRTDYSAKMRFPKTVIFVLTFVFFSASSFAVGIVAGAYYNPSFPTFTFDFVDYISPYTLARVSGRSGSGLSFWMLTLLIL